MYYFVDIRRDVIVQSVEHDGKLWLWDSDIFEYCCYLEFSQIVRNHLSSYQLVYHSISLSI